MRDRTLWILQNAAGGLVLVLLGLHMTITHLPALVGAFNPAGSDPVSWANVVARGHSPGFLAMYVALLGTGLLHGLIGLRGLLLELDPRPALRRGIGVALPVAGVALFVAGTWAAWASFALAQSA
jgi:succinate dehydrogenase hydrophobic anchor subunit